MSMQPVNKAVEHLINSIPVLEEKRGGKVVNAYLIKRKNGRGGGGGGGGHSHKQLEGLGGVTCSMGVQNRSQMTRHCNGNHSKASVCLSLSLPSSIMSQSIPCNYFKVCTKFRLEGAE